MINEYIQYNKITLIMCSFTNVYNLCTYKFDGLNSIGIIKQNKNNLFFTMRVIYKYQYV